MSLTASCRSWISAIISSICAAQNLRYASTILWGPQNKSRTWPTHQRATNQTTSNSWTFCHITVAKNMAHRPHKSWEDRVIWNLKKCTENKSKRVYTHGLAPAPEWPSGKSVRHVQFLLGYLSPAQDFFFGLHLKTEMFWRQEIMTWNYDSKYILHKR